MIIVVGTVEVAESDRGRYLESRRDQVAHTLDETGCLDYSFAADATHPDRVRLLERWRRWPTSRPTSPPCGRPRRRPSRS